MVWEELLNLNVNYRNAYWFYGDNLYQMPLMAVNQTAVRYESKIYQFVTTYNSLMGEIQVTFVIHKCNRESKSALIRA